MEQQTSGDSVAWFCRQVRARSREHQEAMPVATQHGWVSVMVGLLRQELDSMVRVIYLVHQHDPAVRSRLLEDAVSGRIWMRTTSKGKLAKVTDRDMVDLADGEPNLEGWTDRVYQFGCSFIHLSNLHDYLTRDPFRSLPSHERQTIARYLREYHGGDVSADSTFDEITLYVPKVLNKIASNLERYLEELEHTTTSNHR